VAEVNGKMSGTVIQVFFDNGYGFIRGEDRISRYFHVSDVVPRVHFDLMYLGQRVTFVPVDMGEKNPAMKKGNGLRASKVECDHVVYPRSLA
jgi:cold shock CspA family protein